MENTGSEIRSIRSETAEKKEGLSYPFAHLILSQKSLQLFRWLFGFFILFDLVQHFQDVSIFYTNAGFVPLSLAREIAQPWHHSIYLLSSHPLFVYSLYIIHLALAFLFTIGRGLPWVTVALWIFQFSLRNRNFSICDGGDDYAVILLFLSIFLPLVPQKKTRKEWNTLWSMTFVTQVLALYFFSAVGKSDVVWTTKFTATFLSFRLENMVTPLGAWLYQFPSFLKIVTFLSYHLELLGPPLYWVSYLLPFKLTAQVRKSICICFILFHIGILLTIRIWAFPLICIAAWIALYPRSTSSPSLKNEKPSPLTSFSLLIPFTILITILNWNMIELLNGFPMLKPIRVIGQHLSLRQKWGMFAPYPALNNQKIFFTGKTFSGEKVTLMEESDWRTNRHRVKYLLNFNELGRNYLNAFGNYLCKMRPDLKESIIDFENYVIDQDTLVEKPMQPSRWIQPCVTQSE